MANSDFFPEFSTDVINVGSNFNECLTDTLEEMQDDIEGKAEANHSHTDYAPTAHSHTEYAPQNHSHDYATTDHTHDYAASEHTHTEYATVTHEHSYTEVACPPMLFGEEYLTNEMWNGQPLYTTLINCGTFADSTNVDTQISCQRVVRYCGRIGEYCSPFIHNTLENAYSCWVEVSNFSRHIRITMQGGANVGNLPVEVQVWYTKPTE